MPRRCAFKCEPSGVSMHRFPNFKKFPEVFKTWVYLVGGKLESASDYDRYKELRVCDIHFTDRDRRGVDRLFKEAIPSLHVPGLKGNVETQPSTSITTDDTSKLADTAPPCVTEKPSTTTKEQPPAAKEKEPSTKTNENVPLPKTIDYVKEGICTVDKPVFEFEPNDDYSLQDIVTTMAPSQNEISFAQDDSYDTAADDQDVIMSEISTEPVEDTSDMIPRVTRDTCGPDDACTTHDTTRPIGTQAIPKDNKQNMYWKSKLTHILHSTQFCGICLCTEDTVHSLNDQFDIVVCDNTHTTTLADILHIVFRETEDLLSNLLLCGSCTNKLIQSYMFIQQARETSKILNCHVQDLYYKSCYIRNSVLKEQEQKESPVQNVLIALENFDTTNSFNTIHTIQQTKKEEKRSMRPKQRRKYKCLRCNLYLPSYKAWMVHEINNHKNQITFKTHMNFSRPNQQALKICKICQRVIQSGGLTEHMKKYHERSTRICSICNITFDSFKALVTHKQEWHYKVDSKCLTCLENYSESELEQHQCRFGCGSCAEVPCVHHKYLMCYREQILNGALRPKCLDCLYVCRTKEALLKHVNMCHLKHRPKTLLSIT